MTCTAQAGKALQLSPNTPGTLILQMLPPGMLSLKTQPHAVEGTGHIQATGHTQVAPACRLAEPSLLATPGQTPDMHVKKPAAIQATHPAWYFRNPAEAPEVMGQGQPSPSALSKPLTPNPRA